MVNLFNKPINEIIKSRHSVRSYQNTELSNEVKEKLLEYIGKVNNLEGIFGGRVRIELVQKNDTETKLGTYGVIRGASNYLAVAYKESKYDLEDLGFLFEMVILYCTSLGLGTVWLGGTFNKGNFAKAINLEDDEKLPIVSPLGIEGEKKSIIEKILSNSLKRKDFSSLFFNENFDTPLTSEDAKEYNEVLEMVRLAPSAMNRQPWKILKEGNNYHIYSEGKNEMSRIDIGICLCHFYLIAIEKGLNGEFKVLDDKNDSKYKYVVSWIEY